MLPDAGFSVPAMTVDSSNLRERLRLHTESFHKELERAHYPALLLRDELEPSHITEYFWRLLAVHTAWEAEAARFTQWSDYSFEITPRFRAEHLRQDLALLAAVDRVPVAVDWRPGSFAGAVGALYVLEGSTLGGQSLAPRVEQSFGCKQYLAGRGSRTGVMWREFCDFLTKYGQSKREEQAEVIGSACRAFLSLGTVLG